MRGYIYRKINDLFYKCHNCGSGMSIGNLIKQLDGTIYKEYLLEKYKSGELNVANTRTAVFQIPAPRFGRVENKEFTNAERCDLLPSTHFCIAYLRARKIPESMFSKLYFTTNFKKLCDEVNPDHGKDITADARLVIPFYDEYNALIGLSGRALTTADSKLRYVKIKVNDNVSKLIFGQERLDRTQTVKIVEGELDSLFLSNCIASGDSSLSLTAKELIQKGVPKENIILCPDREPRNREIVNTINKFIEEDFRVCLFPDNMTGKDINEHIINGYTTNQLEKVIEKNNYHGLRLRMVFSQWKKI